MADKIDEIEDIGPAFAEKLARTSPPEDTIAKWVLAAQTMDPRITN